MTAPLPENEADRLVRLRRCHILDTLPEDDYNGLVSLAAQICGAPMAVINLVDAQRQWLKARYGTDMEETCRSVGFCPHAILEPDRVMVVADATVDPRFHDDPFVLGDPGVRFYAGAPIVVQDAAGEPLALGTVCVIDFVPRTLGAAQETALQAIARQVGNLLDLRLERALQEETVHQLRETERRLNQAQAVARIGSWEFDTQSGKITWSPEIFRLLQFDPAQGEPSYEGLLARYHPSDVPMHRAHVERALVDGTPYEFEIRAILEDGSVRWVHAHGQAVKDSTGLVVRLMGTVQDISERKAVQDELAQANASLKQFTSVASHDLKEPLRKIQMFGQMVLTDVQRGHSILSERSVEWVDRMVSASARMTALTDGLLALSQVSQPDRAKRFGPVDLTVVAREVMDDLEARLQETGGRVQIGALPLLWADPLQMRQLLQNLIGNALKYHRDGCRPVVQVDPIAGAPMDDRQLAGFAVSDNGQGFAPESAVGIFDAFERLDGSNREGAGVGLAICRQIVENHGGTIRAEGRPGVGATFTVYLPAAESPRAAYGVSVAGSKTLAAR